VTVVVSLNSYGSDFTGGLFVRSGSDESQHFLDLTAGDVAVHQYDLEHGVEVRSGSRYSWILWFQDRACSPSGHQHWHQEAAAAGDPVAMFNIANVLSGAADAIEGGEKAGIYLSEAFEWYQRSAEAGFYGAMYSLGIMVSSMCNQVSIVVCAWRAHWQVDCMLAELIAPSPPPFHPYSMFVVSQQWQATRRRG
jgi:hypothetical protein